jgi:hypothetical protein
MGSPVVHQYILEHMPLDWANPYQSAVLFFALLYLLAMANLRNWRCFRVTWLLPCVWFFLTIDRVRQCTLFAITTALVLVEVLPHTGFAEWLVQRHSRLYQPRDQTNEQAKEEADRPQPAWQAWVLPALALGVSLLLEATGVGVPLIGAGWAELDPVICPMPLREPLVEIAREHPGAPVFNDMAYGGFLIYYTPGLRPFIDDRCELYGDAFLADYFQTNDELLKAKFAKQGAADVAQLNFIDRWEKQFGITLNYALVMKESGFHYYFETMRGEWTKLDETSDTFGAALYRRRGSPSLPKPPAAESR